MPISYQHDGAVAEIVIDSAAKLNALHPDDVARFSELINRARQGGARAVLLRAEGRAFSVGRDLRSLEADEDIAATLRDLNKVILEWHELPVPTIVAVQGHCLGAGAGLALAGDIVVASRSAVFSSPFGKLGAMADCGFHWHLTTRLGSQAAKDLLLTGRSLSGSEAQAIGLIARCVEDDELFDVTHDLAAQVASGPTTAFGLSISLVDRIADGMTFADSLEEEARGQGIAARTSDFSAGLSAFLAKKSPIFTGQ